VRIQESIENNVAALVEEQLDKYVPKELREKVDTQRVDMQTLHVNIHNSEARRANSSIKTPKQFNEQLQYLVGNKGTQCPLFPKTVTNLLEMEDAKTIELVKFFGNDKVDTKSRIPNVNWFLRYIGVAYQPHFLG